MADIAQDWPAPADIATFADGDPDEDPWVDGPPPPETIRIAPYSPEWPALFAEHRARIAQALGEAALAIEHVGSTAVPDLAAKPIVDIDLIVADPSREAAYVPPLAALGYVLTVRERTWYQHRMLEHDAPRLNLHVFGPRCPEHARHVLFRDWLRAHPQDRRRYERAKAAARRDVDSVRAYNRNKQALIRDIYRRIFEARGWGAAAP